MAMQPSSSGRYSYSTTGAQAPPTYNPSASASSFVQQQQPYGQSQQPQQYGQQQPQQYGQQQPQQPQQPQQYASPAAVQSSPQGVIRHHRRAPPPPANFVPPSGQAPGQQPPQQYGQAQQSPQQYGQAQQPPQAYQQPSQAPPQPQRAQQPYQTQPSQAQVQQTPQAQASPQYARQQQPQQQQPQQPQQPQAQQPQAQQAPPGQQGDGEKPKGWMGTVTTTVSSWWGKDKRQQQQRDDLMAGATAKPVYTTSSQPAAVGATWEDVQSNPEMRQQQYAALQLDNSATQLALQKAREAQGIGMATMESLARQGEMIDTVSTNVETIHLQLDRGDRQMRSIQGVTGSLSNFVTPDKAERQNKMVYNMANNKVDRTLTPVLQEVPAGGSPQQGSRYGSQHMASAPATLKDQIAEQDAALDELSSMLGNLQSIARTTGTELDRQNQQLDTVNVRTQHAMQRTHDTNYRLQRMM